ncbi:hypothetical protein [Pseudoalteromonas rubra]|uniref:Uncharacterized protein n=1 Tax=Pseudoalteromonas rubra TaxID=43658 RepID=A0A0F4QDW6_9GAMM|nr:hypothetical protein [Pseudoalteromonas rubra]KJZ05901.1 hypothetical protein TW77_21285 [Pseudoalteromonas rubra]
MILNTSIQGAVSPVSQYASVKTTNTEADVSNQSTQASATAVKHTWDSFRDDVESDPVFAREMAEAITFIPNKMTVNLNEAPPLTDPVAHKKWADQSVEFDRIAEQVTEQRIALFNRMKGEGASDADIYNEMIAFNKTLPMDYQAKAGMLSVNEYA